MLVRAAHRGRDVGERRPRLALELDLDRDRAGVARVAKDLEHPSEVDDAVAAAGEVPVALPARRVLQVDVREIRRDRRQVVDRLLARVELDVGGVVVDPDRVTSDLLDQRDRDVARGHDVAVDLECDDDACRVCNVGERSDVGEERALVLVGRLVAADGAVHDREAVLGGPLHRLDPVGEPVGGRQVGVPRETHRLEPVALDLPACFGRGRGEIDVLRPAGNGRQFDVAGSRLRRSLQAPRRGCTCGTSSCARPAGSASAPPLTGWAPCGRRAPTLG